MTPRNFSWFILSLLLRSAERWRSSTGGQSAGLIADRTFTLDGNVLVPEYSEE